MRNFYSTNKQIKEVSLQDAVLQGLAKDGGLFMPNEIPSLPSEFFDRIHALSFSEIAYMVAKALLKNAIPDSTLKMMIENSLSFDAPLVALSEDINVLELFHGPTLSFKDFGARFMACLMAYFAQNLGRDLHILVATSGDTGSAVAQGFFNMPGIRVWILYPRGKVSLIQEKQLTTVGQNVTALEIDGTFDDCQTLVKQAFNDPTMRQQMELTSANSINIARLIPQTFYYFYAYAQLKKPIHDVIFSVPSGNFGNLTAGLVAKRMGLPISHFVAATNINDSVPQYLQNGIFQPRPSKQTLSNAMDVGNPSNFARMLDLYQHDVKSMRKDLSGKSFSDKETQSAIITVYHHSQYLMDPHGAVAYLGLKDYQKQSGKKTTGIFLETAHPAKFLDVLEPIIDKKVTIPERLNSILIREKQATFLSNQYLELKHFLITANKT